MTLGLNPMETALLIVAGFCLLISAVFQLISQYGASYLEKVDLSDYSVTCYRVELFSQLSAHSLVFAFVLAFIFAIMQEF